MTTACRAVATLADIRLRYVYGEMPELERATFDEHLPVCALCRDEVRGLTAARAIVAALPSADIDAHRWTEMLHRASRTVERPALPARPRWRDPRLLIAASVVVAIAGSLGGLAMRVSRDREVHRLQTELAEARATAAMSLMRAPRSADRLRGVSAGGAFLGRDARLAAAFASTLRRDPSPNVRLAVLDAIGSTPHHEALNAVIVAALPEEPLPAVRLAMIDLLARIGDTRARAMLRRLAETDADPAVRARALAGADRLQPGRPSVQQ
jgi:hypothetical protein